MTTLALPRALLSGVDTLHVFTRAPLFLPRIDQLLGLKDKARSGDARSWPRIDLAGVPFTVRPHGARTAPLLLDGEHMAVLLSPDPPHNLPTATVELRSLFLWQRGAVAATTAATSVLAQLTRPTVDDFPVVRAHVSRIDIAVDSQGWVPRPEDHERFRTRAEQSTLHFTRRKFTGFMFGRGDTAARLYDKTIEIRKSGKEWFRQLWEQTAGFDPLAPVWRLEYQLRRNALRTFAHGAGAPALDTWAHVAPALPALWAYLCARWLCLRAPRTGRTRQRPTPEWQALTDQGFREGPWAGVSGSLYRIAREGRARFTNAQLSAYLARGVAEQRYLTGFDGPLDDAVQRTVCVAQARRDSTGASLAQRVDAYLDRWRADERAARPELAGASVGPGASEPPPGPSGPKDDTDEEVAA